jgi:cytochrome c oxidase subunit 3
MPRSWVVAYNRRMDAAFDWHITLRIRKLKYYAFIPSASPWPFLTSETLFCFLLGILLWFHYFIFALSYLAYATIALSLILSFWCKDLIAEGQYMGVYLIKNMRCIRLGFKLFIVSEVMFFFALFWAYFHFSLNPSIWIGAMWPPFGMKTISPWGLPLLNTMVLLMSGVTLTLVQKTIIRNMGLARAYAIKWFMVTLFLAVSFLLIQRYEFIHAPFSINDSVYGSIFFLITGTHGLHVIAGTGFLFVCFMRVVARHFYQENALALDLAAMYWHFVDIVWILVFLIVYWWGGSSKS